MYDDEETRLQLGERVFTGAEAISMALSIIAIIMLAGGLIGYQIAIHHVCN